ncbi:MAG: sulfatase-like hydrolase/transferase [Emcibacteraceae bacterium]|nr:sulfatase-like hydrolase/transferase [Emcibacteraceae bacterium]
MLDNPRIKELNQLQLDIPVPWDQVRFDAYTFNFAFEYLKEKRPNVLYISLAETDDYAHDGQYDRYITSAQKSDEFISRLWNWVQNDPEYKDKTTLLITTDHGRGYVELADWKEHGEMDIASDEGDKAIWMAVIGPDTPATGEMKNTTDVKQNQIARTLMKMMGFDYEANHETLKAGNVIEAMMK